MKQKNYVKYIICIIGAIPLLSISHPGGLNKEGCHKNSKTGDYHCHESSTKPPEAAVKPPTPANVCFAATVHRVIDGDTLSVKTLEGIERIRMNQIDAPERSQEFGLEATQCLENLVKNHTLNVCSDGQDRYGRTIAGISVDGNDIGRLMIEKGCAWAYTKYLKSGSDLQDTQENAKQLGSGLWGNKNAHAPWAYRAGKTPP